MFIDTYYLHITHINYISVCAPHACSTHGGQKMFDGIISSGTRVTDDFQPPILSLLGPEFVVTAAKVLSHLTFPAPGYKFFGNEAKLIKHFKVYASSHCTQCCAIITRVSFQKIPTTPSPFFCPLATIKLLCVCSWFCLLGIFYIN